MKSKIKLAVLFALVALSISACQKKDTSSTPGSTSSTTSSTTSSSTTSSSTTSSTTSTTSSNSDFRNAYVGSWSMTQTYRTASGSYGGPNKFTLSVSKGSQSDQINLGNFGGNGSNITLYASVSNGNISIPTQDFSTSGYNFEVSNGTGTISGSSITLTYNFTGPAGTWNVTEYGSM